MSTNQAPRRPVVNSDYKIPGHYYLCELSCGHSVRVDNRLRKSEHGFPLPPKTAGCWRCMDVKSGLKPD